VALINSNNTLKKYALRDRTDSMVKSFYDIQPGNGQVYSYNPGAHMER